MFLAHIYSKENSKHSFVGIAGKGGYFSNIWSVIFIFYAKLFESEAFDIGVEKLSKSLGRVFGHTHKKKRFSMEKGTERVFSTF